MPKATPPDLPTRLSLILMLAIGLMLIVPMALGRSPVSPYLIIALLLLRLGLQIWRAQIQPQLKRPLNWLLELSLIALLSYSVYFGN